MASILALLDNFPFNLDYVPTMESMILSLVKSTNLPSGTYLPVTNIILLLILLIIAGITRWAGKYLIQGSLQRIVRHTKGKWDDILFEQGVFNRLGHILPAVIVYLIFPFFFPKANLITAFVQRLLLAYITGITVWVFDSFLDAINTIYNSLGGEKARRKPIKGHLQMVKILLYVVGTVLIITTIINISPIGILSGLGAMSAVLLLVFKDSIMGLISSIQLAANDMVRIGDWIEMPKYGADGDVIDISLQSIKVRNWDMTITTIPIYALISDSFKNWRGMNESNGRRIKRAIHIDMRSVCFLDATTLGHLKQLRLLKEYMVKKEEEITNHNSKLGIAPNDMISGRWPTNLGTFRAYIEAYLAEQPILSKDMIHMVRYLEPGPTGLPMEIYLFCTDKEWVHYEKAQADIFDHILAIMPEFGLRVFQNPSGWDMQHWSANIKAN